MRSTTFKYEKAIDQRDEFFESWGNPHPPQTKEPQEYFIGDIYDRYDALADGRWPPDDPRDGPYQRKVKSLARNGWPQLRYLADFLDSSTVPIKVLTPEDRVDRLSRCHVTVIDLDIGSDLSIRDFDLAEDLEQFLATQPWIDKEGHLRLFIIEDLCTPIVELLGNKYNIDPNFFRSQISDYTWYNLRDPWFEAPTLPSRAAASAYFTLRHPRPHYFRNDQSAEKARRRVGGFNVLRRIDFDKSKSWADKPGSCVGSVRSSTSCYIRPREEASQGWLGFLLVDPPVREGYPLWGGYDNIRPPPTYVEADHGAPHLFRSPLEDFIFWTRTMSTHEQQLIRRDNDLILSPIFCSIPAQWMLSFEHLLNRLSLIEWEVERKEHRTAQSLDDALQRLHPWRRNVVNFGYRIRASIDTVERFRSDARETSREWTHLLANFQDLEKRYKVLEAKIDKIMSVLTAVMTIEETKKQMRNARDVARITYLAFIYVPLAFVASALSMNQNILVGPTDVYWIFVVVGVPLTASSLLLAVYWAKLRELVARYNSRRKPPPVTAQSLGRSVK